MTIGKDGSVKTLNNAVDDGPSRVCVDLLLGGVGVENLIKTEFERFFVILNLSIFDMNGFVVKELVAVSGSKCFLTLIEGSESAYDLDIGCSIIRFFLHGFCYF